MAKRTTLRSWSNGSEERIEIDNFGKLDKSIDPIALGDDQFVVRDNFVKKVGNYTKLFKRNGIQRYNSNNQNSNTNPVVNLYEAKSNTGYFLLGKETGATASNGLRYGTANDYTSAWANTASSTEFDSAYRFTQFKNNVYLANILNASNVLQANKVWTGSTALYEIGCNPTETDTLGASVAGGVTGGLSAGGYYYLITFLYDGYQESCSLMWTAVTATALSAINLSIIIPNARVKAVKIYRSTVISTTSNNVPAEMYYIATISDTTTVGSPYTFQDVKSDEALGSPVPVQNFFNQKRPYRSKVHTTNTDRLIQANLEIASTKYSAIGSGDLPLTRQAGALNGVYKYRIYKAFFSPSGGRLGYVVGTYTELTTSTALVNEQVTIKLTNPTTHFDNWCNYVLIQRTNSGDDRFAFRAFLRLDTMTTTGLVDNMTDGVMATQNTNIARDIVYAGQQAQDTKYKGSIAISDVGNPDKISGENVKQIDVTDNQGITGIFPEEGRIIVFTASGRFQMDTRAQSSDFWTIEQIGDGIGAKGQDTSPTTETIGHNGILQLPNDSGYVFCNRAYSGSATDQIKIFYWDGRSEPKIISNEINSYLNGLSAFRIYGMCYDHINNWVWISCVLGTTQYVLVFDIEFREWYIFTVNDSAQLFYDVICTEDGRIIFSGTSGKLYNYSVGTYIDNYGSGTPATTYPITSSAQTKSFDFGDENINAVGYILNMDTATSTTTSSTVYVAVDNSETTYASQTTASGLRHRLAKRFNRLGSRLYLRYTNAENSAIILEKICLDYKKNHKLSGGY